jgi:hypothetical protein
MLLPVIFSDIQIPICNKKGILMGGFMNASIFILLFKFVMSQQAPDLFFAVTSSQ